MIKIVQKKTDDLTRYANNSRTHSDEQIAQIVASINEFGFTNPLLINYVDVMITRWQNFTGKEASLQSSGQTYNSQLLKFHVKQ